MIACQNQEVIVNSGGVCADNAQRIADNAFTISQMWVSGHLALTFWTVLGLIVFCKLLARPH